MAKGKTSHLILFFFIIAACIVFPFYFEISLLYIIASSLSGMIATFLAKEGKWYAFLLDIISYIFYIPICIKESYKGELILSFFIIIINIFCLKEWKKNIANDFVVVKKISKNELNFISIIFILFLSIYALFLYKIKSEYAILNAISTCSFLLSNYFSYKRSILQFYSLIVYEIAYSSLWVLSVYNGELGGTFLFVGACIEFIFDIMAIIKWKKISKLQTSVKCKSIYMLKY